MALGMKRLAAVAAIVVLAAVGCSNSKTDRLTIDAAAVNGKPGFTPEVIEAKKGDKVVIKVGNTTEKTHGFSIEGYGLKATTVDAGKTVDVKFTAKKTGTYKIFCQLHPAHQFATFQVD
jgi:nitrosocyanin